MIVLDGLEIDGACPAVLWKMLVGPSIYCCRSPAMMRDYNLLRQFVE